MNEKFYKYSNTELCKDIFISIKKKMDLFRILNCNKQNKKKMKNKDYKF